MNEFKIIQISSDELKTTLAEVLTRELPRLFKIYSSGTSPKEFLSRDETAKMLGISLSGLHSWVNQGFLHPKKIGGKTYFKYSEIREILENK